MFTTTGGSEEEDEVLPLVTDDEEESSEEDVEDLRSVDGVEDYEASDKDLGDLDERVWKRARKIPVMRKITTMPAEKSTLMNQSQPQRKRTR